MSTAQIPHAQLYEQQREPLSLEVLTKGLEARGPITISDINRPGMALMGYPENFLFERIQILGRTEIAYLGTLSTKGRAEALDRLFQFAMPAIIVTKGLQLPDGLLERANRNQVPVLRTPQDTTPFIHQLTSYLDWGFA